MADAAIGGPVTHHVALSILLKWIAAHSGGIELAAAGHRVVHGGREFTGPVKITADVMRKLEALCPLAPLHQPHNLAAIRALSKLHPDLPQVACFDTSFHTTQPAVATAFALPRRLTEKGVRRYGFTVCHTSISPAFCRTILGRRPTAKLSSPISAMAPACAPWSSGESIATTMGFSALDGLVMGKRCGSLDPGVILYLLDHEAMNSKADQPSAL